MKLYELGEARDILDGFLAETEGEETPEVKDLFEQWQAEVEQKVEATGLYIRELIAESIAMQAEQERMALRRQAHENRIEKLKEYLAAQMQRIGLERVKGPRLTVAFQNSGAVLVVDETVWTPEKLEVLRKEWPQYVRVKPEVVELNRAEILRLLKSRPENSELPLGGFSLRTPRWLALR